MHLVALSDGLVTLLAGHAALRVESLRSLEQLVPLLVQLGYRLGVQAHPLL